MPRLFSIPALLCGLALSACQGPPQGSIGNVTFLQPVMDSAVFEAIQVFQIHVLDGATKGGAVLACSDMPGTYREDSPEVTRIVDPPPTAARPQDPNTPVKVEKIVVPADKDLVFVVLGLAVYKGTHVVARGCKDSQKFEEGSSANPVSVDVRATTGARCGKPNDCERNLTCITGPGFEEGYCAVPGCSTGQKCPPGSACISEQGYGGLCLRSCKNMHDCELQQQPLHVQDCQGRLSLSSAGCAAVCVQPNWSKANCCNAGPSNCGSSDGGI